MDNDTAWAEAWADAERRFGPNRLTPEEFARQKARERAWARRIDIMHRMVEAHASHAEIDAATNLGNHFIDKAMRKFHAVSPELRQRVLDRDGHKCRRCDERVRLCMDHVHPFTKGGPTTFENLQTLCRSCNSRKKDRVEARS